MAHTTRFPILAGLALAAALPACQHSDGAGPGPGTAVVVQERGGPPPHAPAHGYRRKQHVEHGSDLELVFDSGLGVYVVVGFPDLYFYADHYFRLADSGWQISLHHDSGWTIAAQSQVPTALWKSKPASGKKGVPPGQAKKGGPPGPAKQR